MKESLMKLSDIDILEKIAAGEIIISPEIQEGCIGSFSLDLRLGNIFRVLNHEECPFIDLGATGKFSLSETMLETIEVPEWDIFYLSPGELALGITKEHITLPDNIAGWLDGRSSLARVGLMVHITAHTIDPGWSGKITLEFANVGRVPLGLRPGMRICAISFDVLSSSSSRPYYKKAGAKYSGQAEPVASRIDME